MKRFILSLIFVAFMSTTAIFAAEAEAASTRAEILAGIPDIAPAGQIIIGSPAMPDANIVGWGSAINTNVHRLIFDGLNTMERGMDGIWFPNPIVTRYIDITDNADGSRTYTFTIYTNNRFSDGTYITARHYAAYLAFYNHKYFWEFHFFSTIQEVLGRDAWGWGVADTFAGVRLYSEEQFSVTIGAEWLPNVWEVFSFMNHRPLPYHAIIPGATLMDNGDGVFFEGITREMVLRGVEGADALTRVENRRLQEQRVLFPNREGFLINPAVVPGPYRFVSFDEWDAIITLEVNPYFPGTWDGYRPRIETIIFRHMPVPLLVDALDLGEIDMIVGQNNLGIAQGVVCEAFDRLIDGGTHNYIGYPRHGYGLIRFHTDHGPTQFTEVRQAIKWLLDRDEFAYILTNGRSITVHGPYSYAMWWYQEALERGLYDRIIQYYRNPQRAVEILEAGGWVLNHRGQSFRPGIDAVRYKDISGYNLRWDGWGSDPSITGNLMRLEIQWATFFDNRTTDVINLLLPHEMEAIGMQLTPTLFDNALVMLMRSWDWQPEFHMFNQGLAFNPNFVTFWGSVDPDLAGSANLNFSHEWELFELANDLRAMEILTEEGRDEFVYAWMDFVEYMNYLALDIPLHADIWYDFFPTRLQNWSNNAIWGLPPAIIRAYIAP